MTESPGTVAILVFDGVQIIDFAGPYEVFGQAGYRVFTVALSKKPITTEMGLKVVPAHTLATCPRTSVIVIPGGQIDRVRKDPIVKEWLLDRTGYTDILLSVCNGAFTLAETGLLDDLNATTYYELLDVLKQDFPSVEVVHDQRFVDNGQIVATSGLSSGIDGALHVVAKLLGQAHAQRAALNLEYNWQPDAGFARAALADRHLRRIFGRNLNLYLGSDAEATLESTVGGRDHWEIKWRIAGGTRPERLMHRINEILSEEGRWENVGTQTTGQHGSTWEFADLERKWSAFASLVQETSDEIVITIKITRF